MVSAKSGRISWLLQNHCGIRKLKRRLNMSEIEKLRKQIAEKIKMVLYPDYYPEEVQTEASGRVADQILALIKETGYLPVEPVKLEVLTDEELHKADNKLGEDFYRAEDPEAWLMDRRNISEATIVHNEAKGRLYRMKK